MWEVVVVLGVRALAPLLLFWPTFMMIADAPQAAPGPWLSAHAWEAADPAASPLAGSPVGDLLSYRRHLHHEVLELLKGDQLSDVAKAECCRLLSILRVSDRESIAAMAALVDWLPLLQTPTQAARRNPSHGDVMLLRPGYTALRRLGLPAALPLLESPALTPEERVLSAQLLAYVSGGAARAMAAEAWGQPDDPEVSKALAKFYGDWPSTLSIQYCLVISGANLSYKPLGQVLSTEDFPTRLSVAQDLIRRERHAEQWLCEALAAGNPRSAGWEARQARLDEGPGCPDDSYIVGAWPFGQEPPKSLTPDERTACIMALGEMRSQNRVVLQVLMENLTFMPDSWPYKVGPAGLVLARAGMPAVYSMLGLSRDPPEVRRAKLDVIGLMLGRFAAEPFRGIWEKNFRPWLTIGDDIAYLEREYAGAKGIYEYIPDEPSGVE